MKKQSSNCDSGNEKINSLIQEMQLRIKYQNDIVFEWVPYNQFDVIKTIGKDDLHLAIWKDGPSYLRKNKVILKYLCDSQNITDEVLNQV